ncbi:uncharacterized protein LOC142327533 [Lycorma delicatula]|uniref:uncharacterized protein LOC142327533 n=1 Tax=Lycorma delicatula TaxID=130591 RepID=UPI003F50E460
MSVDEITKDIGDDLHTESLLLRAKQLARLECDKLAVKIMDGPISNTFINEVLSVNKDIKLETEQDDVAEITFLFVPHHMTKTDTSFEHQVNLLQLKEEPLDVQLKKEPLDIIDDDIEKDPLAIEETNLVKSENFKVENEEVTIDNGTRRSTLKSHLNIHTKEKGYVCNFCQKVFRIVLLIRTDFLIFVQERKIMYVNSAKRFFIILLI